MNWQIETRYRWENQYNGHSFEAFAHKDLFGDIVVCTINAGRARRGVRKIYSFDSINDAMKKLARIHADRRVGKDKGYRFLGPQQF